MFIQNGGGCRLYLSYSQIGAKLSRDFMFQDGLRRRMDKLKNSIEEGNRAVDKEREKNVSLLHLIFPPDIAKRLWLGKGDYDRKTRAFLLYYEWDKKFASVPINKIQSLRGDDRGEDSWGCNDALQWYSRFHFNLFHRHPNDGNKYVTESLQSIWSFLWTNRRLQGTHF